MTEDTNSVTQVNVSQSCWQFSLYKITVKSKIDFKDEILAKECLWTFFLLCFCHLAFSSATWK